MIDLGRLASFLQSAAIEKDRALRGEPQPFITISRQAGARGRSLAEAILTEMARDGRPLSKGWHAYDEELCFAVATDPKLSVLAESLMDEGFRTSVEEVFAHLFADLSPQLAVYKKIFATIIGLATAGKAIIVGRGGRWVTRRLAGGVHLRLVAPREVRLAVIRKRYGVEGAEAIRKMQRLDLDRRRLVRRYFSEDIENPLCYDAVLNMGALPLDAAARLVLELVADRTRRLAEAGAAASGRPSGHLGG